MTFNLTDDEILDILASGEMAVTGRFMWGSNYTFLARVTRDGNELPAVYKPSQGERPLWDFDQGTLSAREVAAYVTSHALGWDLVPPTVLRADGPAGPGSLQLYVDADPERHYFTFDDDQKQRLRPVAVFDCLVNNADRKGGHVLLDPRGHLWLIDHGLCFHEEDKLRTVIWDFAGEEIPEELLQDVRRLHSLLQSDGELCAAYAVLLSRDEIEALSSRTDRLLTSRRFPVPDSHRPYPWPLV
jgi:uncharacterized repeat protein (TIGR03843 family)